MHRFKNILYVTQYDELEQVALQEACMLAKENQADLTITSILPTLPAIFPHERQAWLNEELNSIEKHRQEFVFKDFLAPFKEDGVRIVHQTLTGISFIEIIRNVLEQRRDLVIVPADPLFEDGRGFSSTVMHLMRKCPCPVWAVRTAQNAGFRNILAAVDVAGGDLQSLELNRDILRVATTQARRSKARLEVVHAWQVVGKELLLGPLVDLPEKSWEDLHAGTESMHRKKFDHLLDEFKEVDVPVTPHLVEGDPVDMVTRQATQSGANLLVMGTLSQAGVDGLFMGHTSEEILHHTRCSVFAIKPAWFVSPVTLHAAAVPN